MQYYINLICSIAVFIIGTLFGSFFTLATYRIPRKQDIVKTRSYCPNCKHRLGFFDCFPILSYVSTIGRCRYCKKPISIRYPLIEFASGLVFLLIYLFFGFSIQALILVICYIYTVLVVGVDIMKKKMTEEEKLEVLELKEQKKKIKKTGAINIDILIAIIVFVIFFMSTILVRRNYTVALAEYKVKSDALNLCMNNINEAKFSDFNALNTYSGTSNVDNKEYTYFVDVLPYVKDGNVTVDNVKVIVSTVRYVFNGVEDNISLKCLKVKSL